MNLVLMVPDLGGVGGIQRLSRLLAQALQEVADGSLRVFTLRGGEEQPKLPVTWSGPAGLSLWSKLAFSLRLLGSVIWRRPDIIVCGHVSQSPVAWLALFLARVPYVVVCYGTEVWRPLGRLTRLGLRRATQLWSISRFTSNVLQEVQGVHEGRIRLLPPAVTDVPARTARRWHGGTILSVARLEFHKALDVLIRATARVADRGRPVRLVIVGEGPQQPLLEQIISDLGMAASVQLAGKVPDSALDRLYRQADLFALVSRTRVGHPDSYGEGFGIVYLEAAVRGLPVIAGSYGGSAEAVVDGVTGLLVPPDDVEALSGAIQDMLQNPHRARILGDRGRRWVLDNFSYNKYRARLALVLGETLKIPSQIDGSDQ